MSEQTLWICGRCGVVSRDKRHAMGVHCGEFEVPLWEPVVVLPAPRAVALLRLEEAVKDKDDLLKMMLQTTPPSERAFMRYAVPAICAALLARMEATDGK